MCGYGGRGGVGDKEGMGLEEEVKVEEEGRGSPFITGGGGGAVKGGRGELG